MDILDFFKGPLVMISSRGELVWIEVGNEQPHFRNWPEQGTEGSFSSDAMLLERDSPRLPEPQELVGVIVTEVNGSVESSSPSDAKKGGNTSPRSRELLRVA